MRAPETNLIERSRRIVSRIAFHACNTLVFVRPDGVIDSVPAWSPRASSLQSSGAAAGFRVVGVYGIQAKAEQIAADAREAMA